MPGLDAVPYLTNETVFDLATRPEHLIVIGGGPVGLELAQAFRRLGAAVTVLEAAAPLAHEDRECADVVLDALARSECERAGIVGLHLRQFRHVLVGLLQRQHEVGIVPRLSPARERDAAAGP